MKNWGGLLVMSPNTSQRLDALRGPQPEAGRHILLPRVFLSGSGGRYDVFRGY